MSRAVAVLGAIELPITTKHAIASASLPKVHRDPFDRLLIAQAIGESATLVTADRVISRYGVPVLWAIADV